MVHRRTLKRVPQSQLDKSYSVPPYLASQPYRVGHYVAKDSPGHATHGLCGRVVVVRAGCCDVEFRPKGSVRVVTCGRMASAPYQAAHCGVSLVLAASGAEERRLERLEALELPHRLRWRAPPPRGIRGPAHPPHSCVRWPRAACRRRPCGAWWARIGCMAGRTHTLPCAGRHWRPSQFHRTPWWSRVCPLHDRRPAIHHAAGAGARDTVPSQCRRSIGLEVREGCRSVCLVAARASCGGCGAGHRAGGVRGTARALERPRRRSRRPASAWLPQTRHCHGFQQGMRTVAPSLC